jgi:thiol-disulfide isomerase/thioredoxin
MFKFKNYLKSLFAIIFIMSSVSLHANNLPNKLLNMPIQLISGEHVSLAQYKNKKPVYLKFWATWCQPCLKEMPHFKHVQDKYGESIEVIGVNLGINDDLTAVKKIIKEFGLTMPVAMDENGDLAQAFRMVGTPYHLLFDRNMNLVHQGHEANESLDNKLALVSKTKPVDLLNISLLSENESNSLQLHGVIGISKIAVLRSQEIVFQHRSI